MADIIGIDHIYLTASDLARSERYYDAAMTTLGYFSVFHSDPDRIRLEVANYRAERR